MHTPLRIILSLISIVTLLTTRNAHAGVPATLVSSESRFGPDAQVALSAYRGLVEEHILGVIRTLRILATTQEARSGQWEQIKPLLSQYGENLPTDATTWFVQPDGNYFPTETSDIAKHSLQDRPYFPALIAGKEVFGDLVVSRSTGHRSVIVAVPIVAPQAPEESDKPKVLGALGASLRVRLLSELVDNHTHLPEQAYFYALEHDTRIALHRKADRMFKTPSDVGDEALGEQFKRELQHNKGSLEYSLQGKKIAAIYERSPALGWYFFLAKEVPAD